MASDSPASTQHRQHLQVKVCGMKEAGNIRDLVELEPDMVGFIFYPKSPRHMGEERLEALLAQLPETITKVGVFVNEKRETMLATARNYGLQALQLHGDENPETCASLRAAGYRVFKAFGLHADFDFQKLVPFVGTCDLFVFDTKSQSYGGNGVTFDWSVLQRYTLPVPFLLSGGIGPEHVADVKALHLPQLAGVDLNSRFEIFPGQKDIKLLREMLVQIRD